MRWWLTAGALLLLAALTAGTAAAQDTVECGEEIEQDTTLTADVGPCPGTALVVTGDDVTLDLGGHTVSGDPQARTAGDPETPLGRDRAGIHVQRASGVEVVNGTVERFDAGVAITRGGDNTVRGVTARDNVNYRVVTGADAAPDDVDQEDGPFCWLGDGVSVQHSSGNVIAHNEFAGNGPFAGVSLVGDADDNVVADNRIVENDVINWTPEEEPTICGGLGLPDQPMTTGRHVQSMGVRIEGPGADRNIVEGNRIRRSGMAGAAVFPHNVAFGGNNGDNVVRGNRISDTGLRTHWTEDTAAGIFVHVGPGPNVSSSDNTFTDNTIVKNYGIGIELRGQRNNVERNVVNHNGVDGIRVEEGSLSNSVTDNRGRRNGDRAEEVSERDSRRDYDGVDGSDRNEACRDEDAGEENNWSGNHFGTVSHECVAADGTGWVEGPGASGDADADARGPLWRGDPNRDE